MSTVFKYFWLGCLATLPFTASHAQNVSWCAEYLTMDTQAKDPQVGLAAHPEQLLRLLLAHADGPYAAWHMHRPLLGHYATLGLAAPHATPKHIERYRNKLAAMEKDRRWARETSNTQKAIFLLQNIFQIEASIAGEAYLHWSRCLTSAAPEGCADLGEYSYALHQALIAKFIELYWFPGSNWERKYKAQLVSNIHQILPNWFAHNTVEVQKSEFKIGGVGDFSAFTFLPSENKLVKRLLRLADHKDQKKRYTVAVSASAGFVGDLAATADWQNNILLLDPEFLLFTENPFGIQRARAALENARLIGGDAKALPYQARVGLLRSHAPVRLNVGDLPRVKPGDLEGRQRLDTRLFGASGEIERVAGFGIVLANISLIQALAEYGSLDPLPSLEVQKHVARIARVNAEFAAQNASFFTRATAVTLSALSSALPLPRGNREWNDKTHRFCPHPGF